MAINQWTRQTREPRRFPSRVSSSMKRYNLMTGGYVFMQDNKDRNKFHMPGGLSATEAQITKMATDKGWITPKRQYINRIDLE